MYVPMRETSAEILNNKQLRVYQPLGGRKGKPVIPKIVFFPTNLLEFFA
jgi:hypothetical protein